MHPVSAILSVCPVIVLFLLQGQGKARDGARFYCQLTFLTGQKLMPSLRDSLFWQRAASLVLMVKRYLPSVAKSMKYLVRRYLWNLVECAPLTAYKTVWMFQELAAHLSPSAPFQVTPPLPDAQRKWLGFPASATHLC